MFVFYFVFSERTTSTIGKSGMLVVGPTCLKYISGINVSPTSKNLFIISLILHLMLTFFNTLKMT